MYGNQAAWTTLTKTATKGATSITVKGNVSAWPIGGTIAISSTDYDYRQAEEGVITSVTAGNSWGHFSPSNIKYFSLPIIFQAMVSQPYSSVHP